MQFDSSTLVHAFISKRLDYCNQRFVGVSGCLLDKLQSIQNAAARLGARKFDRITPVMWQLHWLPVRQRLKFKMAFLVFKCLCGLAPVYLVDYCKATSVNTGWSHLRSANLHQRSVPQTTHPTVTGVLPPLDHRHGTVYLQCCDQPTSP